MTQNPYARKNEHGVFEKEQCEEIRKDGDRWNVQIRIAHVDENDFRYGCSCQVRHGGFGYAPSENSKPYPTRELALLAASAELMHGILKSYSDEEEHKQAVAWLRTLLQPSLF